MKRIFRPLVMFLLIAGSLVAIVHATPPSGYTLVWSDEFNGTSIDTTHWLLNDTCIDAYTPASDAASVANGYLTQTIYTKNGLHYTTQLDTRFKYQPKYGYIEASIRTNNTSGNWWAFWTWTDRISGNSPLLPHTDGVEMDIVEHRALNSSGADISNQIPSTLHWDGYGASTKAYSSGLRGSGLNSGFHVYGLEWTPSYYKFYIDGTYLWTVNDSSDFDPVPPNAPVSKISQFLLLTGQIANWGGPVLSDYGTLATSVTKMDVDYVRVYQQGPPAPLAPVSVQVGPNASGGYKLAWDLTDNAPFYNVKRATMSGGPYTTIATTGRAATNALKLASSTGVCYVDTTATSGTDYYYVISAVNGPVEGPNSLEVRTNASGYPGVAHAGQWAAKAIFSGSAAYKNIQQTSNVASNMIYQASAWVMGNGRTTLRVYAGGSCCITQTVNATPSWNCYTTSTFSTGTNTQLTVRVDDESPMAGVISVDDVFLGPPGGANMLTNSGFESGTTGWNTSAAAPVWSIVNCAGNPWSNEHSGYQSAKALFTGTSGYAFIRQTVPVVSNTNYEAGVWACGAGRSRLLVYAGSTIISSTFVNPTSTWTYYSVPTFSTGTNTQLTIKMDDESPTATIMYADDFFMGVAGGTNVLINPNFENGTIGWDTTYAGSVWTIGQW